MNLQFLKRIIFIENIFCVYRNFSTFNKVIRVLITFRMMFIFLLSICNIVIRLGYKDSNIKSQAFYCYLLSGDSLIVILLGSFQSRKFQALQRRISSHFVYFDEIRGVVKDNSFKILLVMSIISVVKVYLSIIFFLTNTTIHFKGIPLFLASLLELNLFMCDLRYIFEVVVIYSILCIMSRQLDNITNIVVKVNRDLTKNPNVIECTVKQGGYLKMFDKLSAAYINIHKCSLLFNSIFGIQLTFMITTTNLFYIVLLYHMTFFSVVGEFTSLRQSSFVTTFIMCIIVLYMLSHAAQSIQNKAQVLKRQLCKHLLYSLDTPERYKATKDLLRLVKMRPISTCGIGSINIDMTLLPTCGALCATYTIIALQFNNVF